MENIIGIIVDIEETKMFKSGFRTRGVIVDIGTSASPNPLKIDCRDYYIDYLDGCEINDMVEMTYHLQGRKYEGRYFVNVICDTINKLNDSPKEKNNTFEETDFMSFDKEEVKLEFSTEEDYPF